MRIGSFLKSFAVDEKWDEYYGGEDDDYGGAPMHNLHWHLGQIGDRLKQRKKDRKLTVEKSPLNWVRLFGIAVTVVVVFSVVVVVFGPDDVNKYPF